jgi:Domain of unknown function (DUF3291)
MDAFDLAQVNVARLRAPIDSPQLAGFVRAYDRLNAAARRAPGYRWRLRSDLAASSFGWDVGDSHGVVVNLSTWDSVESLAAFVFDGHHLAVLRRRHDWFHPATEAMTALWWVPGGHRPTTDEAEHRLRHLREHGPTPSAFTLRDSFESPRVNGPATVRPNG